MGLAKLAKKFLTPPPTSTAVERLFSSAGLILDDRRSKLLPETVEKLLFLILERQISHWTGRI